MKLTTAQAIAKRTDAGARYTRREMRSLHKAHLVGSLDWGPLYWFYKDRSMVCLMASGRVRVVRAV